ncbi:MAG TPA: DUF1844 domain-containing protein, partial [Pyrinomonadaceae bacterium]
MKEEQPIFKVTDRRLFNPDGTPREIEREEETKTDTAATAAKQSAPSSETSAAAPSAQAGETARGSAQTATEASPAKTTPSETGARSATEAAGSARGGAAEEFPEDDYAESQIPGVDDPASFINFLMSIASNAAAALGMMEHPVTGQRSVDPELAKH